MSGEWYSVTGITDKQGNIAAAIHRKELWNIVSTEHLMQEQHRYQRTIGVWKM